MKIEPLKFKIDIDTTDVDRLRATMERINEMRKNLGLTKRQIRRMVKYKLSTARL